MSLPRPRSQATMEINAFVVDNTPTKQYLSLLKAERISFAPVPHTPSTRRQPHHIPPSFVKPGPLSPTALHSPSTQSSPQSSPPFMRRLTHKAYIQSDTLSLLHRHTHLSTHTTPLRSHRSSSFTHKHSPRTNTHLHIGSQRSQDKAGLMFHNPGCDHIVKTFFHSTSQYQPFA